MRNFRKSLILFLAMGLIQACSSEPYCTHSKNWKEIEGDIVKDAKKRFLTQLIEQGKIKKSEDINFSKECCSIGKLEISDIDTIFGNPFNYSIGVRHYENYNSDNGILHSYVAVYDSCGELIGKDFESKPIPHLPHQLMSP